MKKLFYAIIVPPLLSIPQLFGMKPKEINSIALLPYGLAYTTNHGFYIMTNILSSKPKIEQRLAESTYQLQISKDRTKMCLQTRSSFLVYRINPQEESILLLSCLSTTKYKKRFKAMFCCDNSLLTIRDEELFCDGKKICSLPSIGGIACHPTERKFIVHEAGFHASQVVSYDTDKIDAITTQTYHPKLDNGFIRKGVYSHTGDNILLLTSNSIISLYNVSEQTSSTFVATPDYAIPLAQNPMFVLIQNPREIIFWNPNRQKDDVYIPINLPAQQTSRCFYPKKIDFLPNGSEFILLLQNHCFLGNIPARFMIKKIVFICWALKEYSRKHNDVLSSDIINLLATSVVAAPAPKLRIINL